MRDIDVIFYASWAIFCVYARHQMKTAENYNCRHSRSHQLHFDLDLWPSIPRELWSLPIDMQKSWSLGSRDTVDINRQTVRRLEPVALRSSLVNAICNVCLMHQLTVMSVPSTFVTYAQHSFSALILLVELQEKHSAHKNLPVSPSFSFRSVVKCDLIWFDLRKNQGSG